MQIIRVFCLDSGTWFSFSATSPHEALEKMLYTLNLSRRDDAARLTENKRTLSLEHCGLVYSVIK